LLQVCFKFCLLNEGCHTIAANVIGLAKVWNFLTVRPVDEHIKETKFPRNDKTSQQTKSVARSAGGLENVRPKTELQ
jgi:hypothetical protein